MRLTDLAGSDLSLVWHKVAGDRDLATDTQAELIRHGLLDGPPDGEFGPVSLWALETFLAAARPAAAAFDGAVARALMDAIPLPFAPGADFAGRVARRMHGLGYFLVRHPDCVNIVYVEGVGTDGRPNDNRPNVFNDVRMLLRFDADGVPRAETWEATTEPGRLFTLSPQNPMGAARIAFDQFKAWSVGLHPRSGSNQHEALVQTAPINVHRDLNKDFRREGDRVDRGLFGINQHWGFDLPVDDIRNASAGCLVGRTEVGHRRFMAAVKADPRFRASSAFRFHTAVLDGADLDA